MEFERTYLPIGGEDQVPVLVGREDGHPQAVFMSYDAYLEIATTLLLALRTLRGVVDPTDEPASLPRAVGAGPEAAVVDLAAVRRARGR